VNLGGFVTIEIFFLIIFFDGFGNHEIVINDFIFCNDLCILWDKNHYKTITSLQFSLTRLADGAINMKLLRSFEVW